MTAASGEAGPGAAIPWDGLLAFGLGVLGLSPEAFWRTTPRELAAAGRPPAGTAPARADLDALMRRFPDEPGRQRRGDDGGR